MWLEHDKGRVRNEITATGIIVVTVRVYWELPHPH
jgi:hypothetical protein